MDAKLLENYIVLKTVMNYISHKNHEVRYWQSVTMLLLPVVNLNVKECFLTAHQNKECSSKNDSFIKKVIIYSHVVPNLYDFFLCNTKECCNGVENNTGPHRLSLYGGKKH